MSDCFDHEVDAWESYDRAMDEGYDFTYDRRARRDRLRGSAWTFKKDPLYYHVKIPFKEKVTETEKAVLLLFCWYDGAKFQSWVPKTICKKWEENSVYIHKPFAIPMIKSFREALSDRC